MASKINDAARAAVLQSNIMDNSPIEFTVGKKRYKVKRLSNWVSGRIDKLVAKSQFIQTVDDKNPEQTITTMVMNRRIVPKCIAYMILRHPVKVFMFHWLYWRYLHIFFRQDEFHEILQNMYSGEEARFFFHNMTFLQLNNTLTIEMTKADMKNTAQKLASEASTTSSNASTGK